MRHSTRAGIRGGRRREPRATSGWGCSCGRRRGGGGGPASGHGGEQRRSRARPRGLPLRRPRPLAPAPTRRAGTTQNWGERRQEGARRPAFAWREAAAWRRRRVEAAGHHPSASAHAARGSARMRHAGRRRRRARDAFPPPRHGGEQGPGAVAGSWGAARAPSRRGRVGAGGERDCTHAHHLCVSARHRTLQAARAWECTSAGERRAAADAPRVRGCAATRLSPSRGVHAENGRRVRPPPCLRARPRAGVRCSGQP
jgi:hypothetical protein